MTPARPHTVAITAQVMRALQRLGITEAELFLSGGGGFGGYSGPPRLFGENGRMATPSPAAVRASLDKLAADSALLGLPTLSLPDTNPPRSPADLNELAKAYFAEVLNHEIESDWKRDDGGTGPVTLSVREGSVKWDLDLFELGDDENDDYDASVSGKLSDGFTVPLEMLVDDSDKEKNLARARALQAGTKPTDPTLQ